MEWLHGGFSPTQLWLNYIAFLPMPWLLWQQLGTTYTVHGAFMVVGGLLFAWSALRSSAFPKFAVLLFGAGLMVNLALAVVPAPDILRTVGTVIRNAGIVGMGYALLFDGPGRVT